MRNRSADLTHRFKDLPRFFDHHVGARRRDHLFRCPDKQRIADLALRGKQIDTYRKRKPVYDRYKASKDKEKFLRGFESEIILFEAAAREIKKAGLTKLPSSEKLKAELDGLSARKTALQTELRKIRREEKEYDTLRQNVDALLERPKEQEQQRQRSNDLE